MLLKNCNCAQNYYASILCQRSSVCNLFTEFTLAATGWLVQVKLKVAKISVATT